MTEAEEHEREIADQLLADIEEAIKLCPDALTPWEYVYVIRTRQYWNQGKPMSLKQLEALMRIHLKS